MSDPLNILVLNHLAERHFTTIRNAAANANILTADLQSAHQFIADTDVLAVWGYMDIRSLYLNAPKLKWVHALTAGIEGTLFPELITSKTILTNSRGVYGITVSEHVLALMLAFSRGLNLLFRQQLDKKWQRVPNNEIHEKTLGIVGLGSIGREIAKKAKSLGMKVLATKRHHSTELFVDQLYSPENLDDMLSMSDFVVTALPLLPETRELFTLDRFKAMKSSAWFINIARGDIVKEKDLIAALQQGLIKGAGLDVFAHEPLETESPLWDMSNVIITPHTAALSPQYLDRTIKLFADNLARYTQGNELINIIDKQKGY